MATQIGVTNLYYAPLVSDTSGGVSYGTPVRISNLISININPNSKSATLFADNGPAETASALGEIEVELNVADIPDATLAILLGHTVTGGVLKRLSTDTAPYVAIGFETLKSNGNGRYVWLLKGKFEPAEIKAETKTDDLSFQTPTIKGKFLKREYDSAWIKQADEDHPDYQASIGSGWFTSVETTDDTTAPTVSSVSPTDGATGVSKSGNIVWTMSEALMASTVTTKNVIVMNATTGTAVAGVVTLVNNGASTTITFNPDSDLGGSVAHIAMLTTNIRDMAGNYLAAPHIVNFTTAA